MNLQSQFVSAHCPDGIHACFCYCGSFQCSVEDDSTCAMPGRIQKLVDHSLRRESFKTKYY